VVRSGGRGVWRWRVVERGLGDEEWWDEEWGKEEWWEEEL